MQLQIEATLPWFSKKSVPDNYTQWYADMYGQSFYQPMPDHYSWGNPTQPTEPFAHMSDSVPPSAYEARHMEVEESDDSGDRHMVRGDITGGLDRGRRETRPPPCGTGGCLDARAGRRGGGRGRGRGG
ncbi:hypothetical protein PIB30_100676 [Stylosanthes scabra]|uniref:Uncharacterized protein n=1 Tax=Stylosanthes scabra TaxID=79078 RepID=A0ABU6VVM6_9FABA|nr:hypothetical protein [Stylosanthes scabra]